MFASSARLRHDEGAAACSALNYQDWLIVTRYKQHEQTIKITTYNKTVYLIVSHSDLRRSLYCTIKQATLIFYKSVNGTKHCIFMVWWRSTNYNNYTTSSGSGQRLTSSHGIYRREIWFCEETNNTFRIMCCKRIAS